MNDATTTTNPTPPKRSAAPILIALLTLAVVITPFLFVGPFSILPPDDPREILSDQPQEYLADLSFPDFTLTAQDTTPVGPEYFDDRFTIVDFVFTNCTLACPVMFSNLIPLHKDLAGTPVRFLSISVDPENDTPETLRDFARRMDIDTVRWTLAVGDRQTIESIIRSLKFTVYDDPGTQIPLDDGTTMDNIVHPTKALLIGPDRGVIGMYSGLEYESVQQLGRDVRRVIDTLDR